MKSIQEPLKENILNMNDEILDSKEQFFRSERSIAHMLPPIKPAIKHKSYPSNAEKTFSNQDLTLAADQTRKPRAEEDVKIFGWEPSANNKSSSKPESPLKIKVDDDVSTTCNEDSSTDGAIISAEQRDLESTKSCPGLAAKSKPKTKPDDKCTDSVPNLPVDKLISNRLEVHNLLTTHEELDTAALAKKVKNVLIANGIGQRIFGQAVLGLTQGSVSDLLSHPKSWKLLSLKGREPFIRMKMWLDDPTSVDMIRQLKLQSGSASSSIRTNFRFPKKKKNRVVLSREDKSILRNAYSSDAYPKQATVIELAQKLNKKPTTIVNWFHNYRSRVKRGTSSNARLPKSQSLTEDGSNSFQKHTNYETMISGKSVAEMKKTATNCILKNCKTVNEDFNVDTSFNITSNQDNQTNASMFLKATVLLGPTTQTVTSTWSLEVKNDKHVLTSADNLRALLLNVCSSSSNSNASNFTKD